MKRVKYLNFPAATLYQWFINSGILNGPQQDRWEVFVGDSKNAYGGSLKALK